MKWWSALAALVVACVPPAAGAENSNEIANVVAVIPVGAGPSAGLAADDSGVWVPSDFDGSLSRIDPSTNQVSATIRLGPSPSCSVCASGVALHEHAVWATSSGARLAIIGIDALANQVGDTIPLPVFPSAVLSETDGTLWLASLLDSAIVHFDPSTQRVLARISVPRPARLAMSDDAVWATSRPDGSTTGSVVRIDRVTSQIVANVEVGTQPVAIASGEGSIWVIDGGRQTLERLDPRTNSLVDSVPVGALPSGVVAGNGSVWVVSRSAPGVSGPALLRIDPVTVVVTRSLPLGEGTPVGLTMGAGSLWVARRNPDTVVRIDPVPSSSTRTGGPPPALLFVLLVASLAAACAWRYSSRASRSAPAPSGRQLAELQRFAAKRPQARSDR